MPIGRAPGYVRTMRLRDGDPALVLSAAAGAVGVSALTPVAELSSGGPTAVWRVTDGDRTYVLKIYLSEERNAWARETSALEVAGSSSVYPELLGVCADPQLIVMSDLGGGSSLADAVMGDDAVVAAATLGRWAQSLGSFHRRSIGFVVPYQQALARRAPLQAVSEKAHILRQAANALQDLAPRVGVDVSAEAVARLTSIPEAFDVPMDVLSPGDTCPDNNVVQGERVTFLDFEYAETRHLAWDVAYLRVPWPTCWCAWRLPTGVAERALDRYREHLRPDVPYVASPEFDHDLELATLGWALESAGMFLEGALSPAAAEETTAQRPGRRPLVLYRLKQASSLRVDSVLADLADRLRETLLQTWGPLPLDFAPAFRDRPDG